MTNHLESFNSILKRKHLPAHLRSGHRLRFDSLIHILITRILPGIYRHRKAEREYRQWLETRFRAGAGGKNLSEVHKAVLDERALNSNKPVCWWEADVSHDGAAPEILNSHRLSISRGKDANTFVAWCAGNPKDGSVTQYAIEISWSGFASCTCLDFLTRGGACKHLRATRLMIDFWVCKGYEAEFYYPTSWAEGERQLQLHSQPTGSGWLSIQSLLNPPDVSPPLIAWSPTVIQTLGLDQTTLDDQEDIVEGLVPEGSDLSEDGNFSSMQLNIDTHRFIPARLCSVYLISSLSCSLLTFPIFSVLWHRNRQLYCKSNTRSILRPSSFFLSCMKLPTCSPITPQATLLWQLNLQSFYQYRQRSALLSGWCYLLQQYTKAQQGQKKLQLLGTTSKMPSPERKQKRKDSHAPF